MDDDLDDMLKRLQPHELAILKWRLQRRADQTAPDPLPLLWFLCAGRGAGKTLAGANHVFELACSLPWTAKHRTVRVALVGNVYDDVKKTMIEGDALALDTLVATPLGMTPIGDLVEGDVVFGGDGRPCNVTQAFATLNGRPCYEVEFKGGVKVIADADHKWLTETWKCRAYTRRTTKTKFGPEVVTTEEMFNSLRHYSGETSSQANHAIRVAQIDNKEIDLPLDPYLFGVWLGDGKSNSAEVTTMDQEILDSFTAAGFAPRLYKTGPGLSSQYGLLGLRKVLREMGALTTKNNKQVPEVYFQGSYDQRLALLQGLMDTDGSITERGQCEFSNNSLALHDAVIRLGGSLGIKVSTPRLKSSGVVKTFPSGKTYTCGTAYVTKFTTAMPVFRLPRKLERVPVKCRDDEYWYVLNIRPVESVPVRCISVDSPDRTYLITSQHIKTHNSGLLGVIPPEQIIKWNRTIGELTVGITNSDGQYREIVFSSYTATTPGKLRGPQFHIAWVDEPAKFDDADADPMSRDTTWSNLILGLRLGEQPHMVITGTPTPCKLVIYLLAHSNCVTTKASTWANRANLPRNYKEELERLDPSSRTYRQEVLAEVLLDNPAALFTEENINADRAEPPTDEVVYKVLGYDPSASSSDDSDEAGIVVVGYTPEVKSRAKQNATGGGRPLIEKHTEAYVLQDLSGHFTPSEQSALVIKTVLEQRIGDLIFEQNQGADMVVTLLSQALRDQSADFTIRRRKKPKQSDFGPIKRFDVTVTLFDGGTHKFLMSAIQATKSKKIRAETASYQYDFHRVHHPTAGLPVCKKDNCRTALEYEMTTWNPENTSGRYMSPNRLDALVYAIHHIFGRHAMHANANSKLSLPAPNRAAPRADQMIQATNRKKVNPLVSIYSVDLMSGRAPDGFDDPFNRRIA